MDGRSLVWSVAVAVAAAAVVFAMTGPRDVPRPLLTVAGVPADPVEAWGGARLWYVPDDAAFDDPALDPDAVLDAIVATLQRRLGTARRDGHEVVVGLVEVDPDDAAEVAAPFVAGGSLELLPVVTDSALMNALTAHAGGDPRAADLGVRADRELWMADQSGRRHQDPYLLAAEPESLRRYLDEVAVADPALAAAPGHTIALERVDLYSPEVETYWRTYYLRAEPIVGAGDIADAEVFWDDFSNQPSVLVTFTRAAGERFGRFTEEHLGDKLAITVRGEVVSAPIIQGAIWGGRIQISLGQAPPGDMTAQAEALTAVFRGGALPADLHLVRVEPVPAGASAVALAAARALFALLVGALALALVFAGARIFAPPPAGDSPGEAPAVDRWRWGRLAVTAAVPVAAYFSDRVPLPALDRDALAFMGVAPGADLSVFALGVMPVLSAFFLVELAALLVPPWRRLRLGGPAGRARLGAATAILSLALALVQAWFVASYLRSLQVIPPGDWPTALTVVTLAAGVFVWVVAAWLVDRFGLGNGYAVVLGSAALLELHHVVRFAQAAALTPAALVALAVGAGALALATAWALRRRGRAGAVSVRLPTSGLLPLAYASTLLLLIHQLSLLGVHLPLPAWLASATPDTWGYFGVHLAIMVALAVCFSVLLSRPPLWRWSRPDADPRDASAAFRAGVALSVGYLVAIAVAHFAVIRLLGVALGALSIIVLTAVVLDLIDEWRARARRPDWVAVWPLHRVQLADPVAEALAAEGIEVHLRAVHYRTLWYFFAPWAPIAVMVPRADAERAHALVGRMLR